MGISLNVSFQPLTPSKPPVVVDWASGVSPKPDPKTISKHVQRMVDVSIAGLPQMEARRIQTGLVLYAAWGTRWQAHKDGQPDTRSCAHLLLCLQVSSQVTFCQHALTSCLGEACLLLKTEQESIDFKAGSGFGGREVVGGFEK